MELTQTQRYWKSHLDALADFDGSAADYARLHGVEVKKLYVYRTVLRERVALASLPNNGADGRFVRVSQTTTVGLSASVGVTLPNGVRLSLPDLNAPGLLERLARL